MSDKSIERIACGLLVIVGMIGLYFKVEFSGFVVFFGLIGVIQ